MPDLAKSYKAKVTLPPGRVLRVSANGTARVIGLSGAPLATTNLNANTQDFGPFAFVARYSVVADTAPASYQIIAQDMREVVVAASVPADNDGRPDGTVYLPVA